MGCMKSRVRLFFWNDRKSNAIYATTNLRKVAENRQCEDGMRF